MQVEEQSLAKCHLPSKFVEVHGAKMHYLEIGQGEPIVFVHGIPTYSYLWRNVMPGLAGQARCIAVDLIGMGLSDKPDIGYRVFDHIDYFTAFMDALNLQNVTLMMHGWGGVIGFRWAQQHESRVKGLAFYEAHLGSGTSWDMLSLPVQQFAALLRRPGASYRAIVQQNYFIRKLLPSGVVRRLDPEEMENYLKPFPTPESRKPLWQYVQDLPLGDGPQDVIDMMRDYCRWLQQTKLPKLMIYSIPGFITTVATIQWAKDHLQNLALVPIESALHLAQESLPEEFSRILREWYVKL